MHCRAVTVEIKTLKTTRQPIIILLNAMLL